MKPLVFVWSLPTTLFGLAFAALGTPFGARLRRAAHGYESLAHPLVFARCAVTLGAVVCYGRGAHPETRLPNGVALAEHERQHVIQARRLGPLYLPLHVAFGVWAWLRDGRWHGPANALERGPLANPPRPWA